MSLAQVHQFHPAVYTWWRQLYLQRLRIAEIFKHDSAKQTKITIRYLVRICDLYGEDVYSNEYRQISPSQRIHLVEQIVSSSRRLAAQLQSLDQETLEYIDSFLPMDDMPVGDLSGLLRRVSDTRERVLSGIEKPIQGRKKNDKLHQWVCAIAELYNKETGFNPSKATVAYRKGGAKPHLAGRFYSLCEIMLKIVDPTQMDKLPNVVEQTARQWGKVEQ